MKHFLVVGFVTKLSIFLKSLLKKFEVIVYLSNWAFFHNPAYVFSTCPLIFVHHTLILPPKGFLQAILISGRQHKKLNIVIEFSQSIFIEF